MTAPDYRGPWPAATVAEWLDQAIQPLRLAAVRSDGFPLLASLWFRRDGSDLLCAVQDDAAVARCLAAEPRCAFEVAPNEPPYHGVRGQALASIHRAAAPAVLDSLIERYLAGGNQSLADWLRQRADNEVVLRLQPQVYSSWDYRPRMD